MAATKKSTAKKSAAGEKKATNKAETLAYIAEETGLTKRDVGAVFDALSKLIKRDLSRRTGPGHYTVPGLMKIKVALKPATKTRKGVNPATGEEMTIKAKPAHNVVKVAPLKALREMI